MKTNLHKYLFVISTALLFLGCEKTDRPLTGAGTGNGKYTISGRFYQNCSRVPLANTSFIFWQPGAGGGDLGTATTNANGSFSFSFTPIKGATVKYGKTNQYGYIEYGQIQVGNYSNIELFAVPTTYLKVSMQVYNNTYTSRDTFYIVDYRKTTPPWTIVVPGPLTSMLLYTVPSYNILNYGYGDNLMKWGFKINNGEYVYKTDTLKVCDTTQFISEIR